MKSLFIILSLTGASFAADGDSCSYGGAPGKMNYGHCRPISGGYLDVPSAQATCGFGKRMKLAGNHAFKCENVFPESK